MTPDKSTHTQGDPKSAESQGADEARAAEADQGGGAEIEQLRAELEEARDQTLRAKAELENYRNRARREMDETARYATVPLIRDLLPVLDNVRRAIEAAEKSPAADALLEGFKMVAQQLSSVLEQHHCRQIDALHEPFDPNLHEAIGQQPSSEHPANTVVAVAQIGYRVHDRVVRPPQVIISSAESINAEAADT